MGRLGNYADKRRSYKKARKEELKHRDTCQTNSDKWAGWKSSWKMTSPKGIHVF